MTALGKIIARETNTRIISEGLPKMSIVGYLEQHLPLGDKTAFRRLIDDDWTYKELLALQLHFKSKEIQNYINAQFTEAINS